MTNLVLTGLAAWITWETVLMLVPLRVPGQAQPLAVGALCYWLINSHHDRWVLVLACVAVVALLHGYAQAERPGPVHFRRPPPRVPRRPGRPPVAQRIPDLPEG